MLALQALLTLAIIGGTPAADCDYPSTVRVGGCSGVLVHPRIVMTAAHCFNEPVEDVSVFFGNSVQEPLSVAKATYCLSNPDWTTFGDGKDWAYCLLDTEVLDIPTTPVATDRDLVALDLAQASFEVKLVGFGRDENNVGGIKRAVTLKMVAVYSGQIDLDRKGTYGGCGGDSGGPAYVRLPSGGWRVLATDSYGKFCGGRETVTAVHQAAKWVEKETGFDLSSKSVEPTSLLTLQTADGGCSAFPKQPYTDLIPDVYKPNSVWYVPGTAPDYPEVALDDGGCSVTTSSDNSCVLIFLVLLICLRHTLRWVYSKAKKAGRSFRV